MGVLVQKLLETIKLGYMGVELCLNSVCCCELKTITTTNKNGQLLLLHLHSKCCKEDDVLKRSRLSITFQVSFGRVNSNVWTALVSWSPEAIWQYKASPFSCWRVTECSFCHGLVCWLPKMHKHTTTAQSKDFKYCNHLQWHLGQRLCFGLEKSNYQNLI